jgi:hypothetical protein
VRQLDLRDPRERRDALVCLPVETCQLSTCLLALADESAQPDLKGMGHGW